MMAHLTSPQPQEKRNCQQEGKQGPSTPSTAPPIKVEKREEVPVPNKRARTQEEEEDPMISPTPSTTVFVKRQKKRNAHLFDCVVLGKFCDMNFIVKGKEVVTAHKNILSFVSGKLKSEVTASKEIHMENVSKSGMLEFLQIIYSDKFEITPLYNAEMVGDLLFLFQKYGLKSHLDFLEKHIEGMISPSNAVKFLQNPAFTKIPGVKELAWKKFKWGLGSILKFKDVGNEPLSDSPALWSREIWSDVLRLQGTDICFGKINEEALFLKFLKWINHSGAQPEDVADLIPLIRFPLMREEFILEHVMRSGLLSKEEILELLVYVRTDNPTCFMYTGPYHCTKRQIKVTKNCAELRTALCKAMLGDLIKLDFTREFYARKTSTDFKKLDKITLQGKQDGSTILSVGWQDEHTAVKTSSSSTSVCTFTLTFEGNDMLISHLGFESVDPNTRLEVIIRGNRNFVSHLQFKKCIFRVCGRDNKLENLVFTGDPAGNPYSVFALGHSCEDDEGSGWNTVSNYQFVDITMPGIYQHPKSKNNSIL